MNSVPDHQAKKTDVIARGRWPAYTLLLAGLCFILLGLTPLIVKTRATVAPGPDQSALSLPRQLAGQPVSDLQVGAVAVNTIQALHGKGFAMIEGAVARYGTATVWAARAQDEAEARAMTAAMRDRIAAGGSPFSPTGARPVGDLTVYALTGLGEAHFYWQAGDKLIWLAVAPTEAEGALRELVRAVS